LEIRGTQLLVDFKELTFGIGQIEPYFFSMAIFDSATNQRVTETFSFDLQDDQNASLLGISLVLFDVSFLIVNRKSCTQLQKQNKQFSVFPLVSLLII
jgi:hypothetical protein